MLKASYLTEKREQVKHNNKSTLVSWMQFYYTVTTTCFGHSCGHLLGGNSKNTDIFIVCRDYSTVKNHTGLIKIPVKSKNSDEYKILEVKNCFLLYTEGTSGGLWYRLVSDDLVCRVTYWQFCTSFHRTTVHTTNFNWCAQGVGGETWGKEVIGETQT
jgi:hypothetical protein